MALVFKDGDYARDERGRVLCAQGNDALLQRVLWRLSVRRGSLPFLPQLGSRLYLLTRERPGARLAAARQYVQEALAEERGLVVEDVTLGEGADGAMVLAVKLEYEGARLEGSLRIK